MSITALSRFHSSSARQRAIALLAVLVMTALLPLGRAPEASGATAPAPRGYWMVASDGGVFSFGDAAFHGSTGDIKLNQPIVGMASTPSGLGYWMVASDGGIFSFGDAAFRGSTGDIKLNKPIVGMASTPSGEGYWMVASDGGIFSFGDAAFHGSTGAMKLNKPIVGMAATPGNAGYWMTASDGGLFSFGDAAFYGSAASSNVEDVTAMVVSPTGLGYWQMTASGRVYAFGDAVALGSGERLNFKVVGAAPVAVPGKTSAVNNPPVTEPGDPSAPTTATTTANTPPTTVTPAEKGKPNVVVIVLDDLREEGVMDVASVLPKTKEWLAQGGTTFAEGYATSPLCCPERAVVWSGRLPHNTGVLDNQTGDNLDRDWIIPRYLRDAGYHTGLVGKFITNWKFRYEPPHFDDYAAFQGGYEDASFWVKDPGATSRSSKKAPYSTDFIADKAVQYIGAYEAHDDQPFYLHIAPHAPHDSTSDSPVSSDVGSYEWPSRHDDVEIPAWNPSPPVALEASRDGKLDKPSYLRGKTLSTVAAEYTHMGHMRTLLAADELVDRVMKELEARGELDNTMVMFTSDNGFSWGERGVTSKGMPYREHVEVPFLVRWPGVFPAGTVDPRPVGGEDILPTLLDAAQYTPPTMGYVLDGRSFLPGQPGKAFKYLEFGPNRADPEGYEGHRGIPAWTSMRTADWQYIETYASDNVTIEFREYYDLRADPWQLENVLMDKDPANDPPNLADLSAQLKKIRHCEGTSGASACP